MATVLIPLCYECAIGDPTTATPAVWITLLRKPADGVWESLPLNASASVWGDEIYFGIPTALGTERGQETV